MSSNAMRALGGMAVVVVAVVLLVVLKGNDSSGKTDGGKLQTIVIDKAGHPVGGIRQLTYDQGDRIRFKVDSDVSDEVHVHGYDIVPRTSKPGGAR